MITSPSALNASLCSEDNRLLRRTALLTDDAVFLFRERQAEVFVNDRQPHLAALLCQEWQWAVGKSGLEEPG